MGKLIDDLLAFSRLGRREIHRVSVDMEGLAKSVAIALINFEPERAIIFTCHSLRPAYVDPAT